MKQGSSLWRAFLRKGNNILQKCLPALLPLCSWRVSKPVSQENYAQNTAHDIAGRFIFDQNTPEIHAFRFGKSRADASGCGPISVYNALLLTGRHFGFSEVIRRMERERGAVRSGVWGANPAAIARVLPLFGVRPRHFREPEQLANAMKNGDTAILMTWNDKNDLRRGAHFFAVQKTAGGYQAYNRFSGQKTPFTRAHFSEIMANARYLSGYVLSPAGSGETSFACPVSSASLASPSSPVSPASCISSASPSPSSVSPSPLCFFRLPAFLCIFPFHHIPLFSRKGGAYMIFTAVIEQTYAHPRRMKYDAQSGTFHETAYDSLFFVRGVRQPYGWIRESGAPGSTHLDVIIMAQPGREYRLGDEERVRIIGVFRRRDGDNKLVGVPEGRPFCDLSELPKTERNDLDRLYPKKAPGEGWYGREAAETVVNNYFPDPSSSPAT